MEYKFGHSRSFTRSTFAGENTCKGTAIITNFNTSRGEKPHDMLEQPFWQKILEAEFLSRP